MWDIKITNFKSESCLNDLLEICYFYISQTKSSLDMIFYKVVYHHIIYMCDFFDEFRWSFCHDLHVFSRRLWFSPDMFPFKLLLLILYKISQLRAQLQYIRSQFIYLGKAYMRRLPAGWMCTLEDYWAPTRIMQNDVCRLDMDDADIYRYR